MGYGIGSKTRHTAALAALAFGALTCCIRPSDAHNGARSATPPYALREMYYRGLDYPAIAVLRRDRGPGKVCGITVLRPASDADVKPEDVLMANLPTVREMCGELGTTNRWVIINNNERR